MSLPAAKPLYAGFRFPAEVISYAVGLYFRFPLSLRMVEEMLAARGVVASHETVRQWALRFGQEFARHHQVAGAEIAMLANQGRQASSRVQAASATPLIAAHISNARALAARFWTAEAWSRRR
jgi:hypothetical protein